MLDLRTPSSAPDRAPTSASWVTASTLDECTDADLDGLGFGVICIDADGTILRYNLYESRFARLDRNQVVGRAFFAEVAPCTRTPEFEGRFRAFIHRPAGTVERFDYLFDFKFGAQHVSVELLSAIPGVAGRFYLLINRNDVGGARPDFPSELLAAEQRGLAPDEHLKGVRRDELERRFIDAPGALFAALRATCERLAPETWSVFANEWGVQWGRRAAVDLEATSLEGVHTSLREVPMRKLAALLSEYVSDRGWGLPHFDFSATTDGLLVVRIERSALAEAAPRPRLRPEDARDELSCHLLAGLVAGVLTAVAGRRLAGREVACLSAGAPQCEIAIFAHERRATVDTCLATGSRGIEAVKLSLRRAPRTGGP